MLEGTSILPLYALHALDDLVNQSERSAENESCHVSQTKENM